MRTLSIFLFSLVIAGPAFGWGLEGHKIVCEVAFQRLTSNARSVVLTLGRGDEFATFSESCEWADMVRSSDRFGHTRGYHFVNIPPGQSSVKWEDFCPTDKHCAPWAIEYYAKTLADPGASKESRANALKFLAHFVGDLHQPLHAGRFADRGGNRTPVSFFGQPRNLHKIWDTSIPARAGMDWPDSGEELADEVTNAQATAWETLDLDAWTDESYDLAAEKAYKHPNGNKVNDNDSIGQDYFNVALPVVREQMKKGGVRLAHVINEAVAGRLPW